MPHHSGASRVAKWVKTCVCHVGNKGSVLGGEDPLEEGMATDFSSLVWEIPWTEEPGGLQSVESKEWDTTEHARIHQGFTFLFIEELETIDKYTGSQ